MNIDEAAAAQRSVASSERAATRPLGRREGGARSEPVERQKEHLDRAHASHTPHEDASAREVPMRERRYELTRRRFDDTQTYKPTQIHACT